MFYHYSRRGPLVVLVTLTLFILLLLIQPSSATIFDWKKTDWYSTQEDLYHHHTADAHPTAVTLDDLSVVNRGIESLDAHDHRTDDCFRDAAKALRQGCQGIELDKDEKTKYAIRLTVCEIETAHLKVPEDCLRIGLSTAPSKRIEKITSKCIQSLGRVPQHWTSYTGYFREVNMMCLAVRYSIEQEELRSLQRNLTRAQEDHIRTLRHHQEELTLTHKLQMDQLEQLLHLHANLSAEVKSTLTTTNTVRDSLSSIHKDVSDLLIKTSNDIAKQQTHALSSLKGANDKILSEYQRGIAQILGSISKSLQAWNHGLDFTLSRAKDFDSVVDRHQVGVLEASKGLELIHDRIGQSQRELEKTIHIALDGANSLTTQSAQNAKEILRSTEETKQSVHLTLMAMQDQGFLNWQEILDQFGTDLARAQEEATFALDMFTSKVEGATTVTHSKLQEMHHLTTEMHTRQAQFFQPLQVLFKGAMLLEGVPDEFALLALLCLCLYTLIHGLMVTTLVLIFTTIVWATTSAEEKPTKHQVNRVQHTALDSNVVISPGSVDSSPAPSQGTGLELNTWKRLISGPRE
ncbi:hypothetical protein BGZ83_010448 [Gryganskiella cystojenkinii]|nr:hypothetical protein BGZ83_010448 [Gryganskiella cystojenkinii]